MPRPQKTRLTKRADDFRRAVRANGGRTNVTPSGRRLTAQHRARAGNPTGTSPGFTLRKRGFIRFEDGSSAPSRRIGKSAAASRKPYRRRAR